MGVLDAGEAVHRRGTLPPELTSLVGRDREMAGLMDQLCTVRLLTLVGPGGVGKTRLALRLAASVLDSYGDGVYLVELGNLSDARMVASAVASALGVAESSRQSNLARVLEHTRDRHLLLIVDNCEHVLDGCAELAHAILRACPRVIVLATSREPLRIAGETTWPVPPLSLDARDERASDAVQLFVERACGVDPRFELTRQNRDIVADICARLEGIPLAIELAAARIRLLPPRALAHNLQISAGGLTHLIGGPRDAPPRQQSLRATIAWSYDLLSSDEQALFRRLAPFSGFSVEAARSVCMVPSSGPRATTLALPSLALDTREGLDSLVNKNLLRVEEDELGQPWYVMLETVRDFAREALEASGEAVAVWRRHTWYCLQLADEQTSDGQPVYGDYSGRRLERELGNFRTALDWCEAQGYADACLRLASGLEWFWGVRGHITEGRTRLETLLARFPLRDNAGPRAAVHARALLATGRLAMLQADLDASEAWLQHSLDVFEGLGDRAGMSDALYWLGIDAQERDDPSAARPLMERGLALSRALAASSPVADRSAFWRVGVGLVGLAMTAAFEGDARGALDYFEQTTALLDGMGESALPATNNVDLGSIMRESGDYSLARAFLQNSLASFERLADQRGVALALAHLGDVAIAQRRFRRSADVPGSQSRHEHRAPRVGGYCLRPGSLRRACGRAASVRSSTPARRGRCRTARPRRHDLAARSGAAARTRPGACSARSGFASGERVRPGSRTIRRSRRSGGPGRRGRTRRMAHGSVEPTRARSRPVDRARVHQSTRRGETHDRRSDRRDTHPAHPE